MSLEQPMYNLWYAPAYPIEGLRFHRDVKACGVLGEFIDDITQSMANFGQRNPVGIWVKNTGTVVRPGKCRVSAAQRLGWDGIAAIVMDWTKSAHLGNQDWVALPYDPTYIIDTYFDPDGDQTIELSRRFACIKKTVDVVQRPGVENPFRKELRLKGLLDNG